MYTCPGHVHLSGPCTSVRAMYVCPVMPVRAMPVRAMPVRRRETRTWSILDLRTREIHDQLQFSLG